MRCSFCRNISKAAVTLIWHTEWVNDAERTACGRNTQNRPLMQGVNRALAESSVQTGLKKQKVKLKNTCENDIGDVAMAAVDERL